MTKKIITGFFVGTILLLLCVPTVFASEDSGYTIQITSSDEPSELKLPLADYVALHSKEWAFGPADIIGKFSGQSEASYTIDGKTYTVQQYSMQEELVEPAGGGFRAVSREELNGYKVAKDIRIRFADDGSGVKYCVQHLVKENSPDIIVTTYPDGLTAYLKCSIGGRPEMIFASASYANTNNLVTTVSHLNGEANEKIGGRQYFKSHLSEKVSVATRLS